MFSHKITVQQHFVFEMVELREEFEDGGVMAQKELWNIAKKINVGKQRSDAKRGERNLIREYKATREERFIGSCAREDVAGKLVKERWRENRKRSRSTVNGIVAVAFLASFFVVKVLK